MRYLPMDKLGARETSQDVLEFGILLPGIDPAFGYSVSIKIIHEDDQYIQSVQPVVLPQAHSMDPRYGDYWSGKVDLTVQPATPNARAWGKAGRYVYRYVVTSATRGVSDFIIDSLLRLRAPTWATDLLYVEPACRSGSRLLTGGSVLPVGLPAPKLLYPGLRCSQQNAL
jgi:hypothetical protein